MAQQKRGPVVVEDARIGLQGTGGGRQSLRTRIPGDVLKTLEAQDGEYFHWQVFGSIEDALAHVPEDTSITVGYIISEEDANPRDIISERQTASSKKSAKKSAKKVAAKRPATDDDEDPFAGAAPKRLARPVAVAPKTAPRLAAPVAARSRTQGPPIAKPGVTRRTKRAGGVRYDTGE